MIYYSNRNQIYLQRKLDQKLGQQNFLDDL